MLDMDPCPSRVYRARQRETTGQDARRREPESQCWQGFLRILPGHAQRPDRFPKPGAAGSIPAEGANRNAYVQRVPTLCMGSRRRGLGCSIARLSRATSIHESREPPICTPRYLTKSGCTNRRVREMNVAHKAAGSGREDKPSLAEHDPAATADTTLAPDSDRAGPGVVAATRTRRGLRCPRTRRGVDWKLRELVPNQSRAIQSGTESHVEELLVSRPVALFGPSRVRRFVERLPTLGFDRLVDAGVESVVGHVAA